MSEETRRSRRRAALAFACLGVGAAALSIAAVAARRTDWLSPDEVGYLDLARGEVFSFLRPPGYPAVLRLLLVTLGFSDACALSVQAAVMSLGALLVAILTRMLGASRAAALCAGGLSAASFTGLALAGRFLADGLLGTLAVLCAVLLAAGVRNDRGHSLLLASLAASAALLLKPIAQIWLVVASLAAAIPAPSVRVRTRRAALLLALPAVAWLSLVAANGRHFGIGSYSGIGGVTLARYWVPATLVIHETSGRWDDRLFLRTQREWTGKLWSASGWSALHYRETMREGRGVLVGRPWAAARALARAAWLNLPRPFHPHEAPWALRSLIPSSLGRVFRGVTWASYALAGLGLALLAGAGRRAAAAGLGGWFLLCSAVTSISFGEGARLMYLAEWTLFVLAGIGVDRVAAAVRRRGTAVAPVSVARIEGVS